MKKYIFLALLCPQFVFAQHFVDVQSEISDVIVYQQSAQVQRTAEIDLPAGSSVIRFSDLDPKIDPNQIKFSATGEFTVMSKSHQYHTDTISGVYDHVRASEINTEKKSLLAEVTLKNSYRHVYDKELALLASNQHFGSVKEGISVEELRLASEFIRQRHLDIRDHQVEIENAVKALQEQVTALDRELAGLSRSLVTERTLEFLVRVQSESKSKASVSLTYQMQQAGWHPSYDARVKDVDSPMEIDYQAKVFQSTGEDWENVKLTIATGNPNLNNVKPELNPWYLTKQQSIHLRNTSNTNAYLQSAAYVAGITQVSGQIVDAQTGEPLPFINVFAVNSGIGGTTDFNGFYSLQIPAGTKQLNYSFIGYNTVVVNVSSSVMNILMESSTMLLEAMTIQAAGSRSSYDVALIDRDGGRRGAANREPEVIYAPVQVKYTPANTQFRIKVPYSIPSDGSQYAVTLDKFAMDSDYLYKCTPKLDEKVYLFAQVSGWEDYNLLSGKMNVYFEDAFIGESSLDLSFVADTLNISLGPDQAIQIERKRIKSNSSRQFISNKRKDTREWEISIRNSKKNSIRIQIDDQVPMSHRDDIEVDLETISGAELDEYTGKLVWDLKIKSGKVEKVKFRYSVKYPKQLNLFF